MQMMLRAHQAMFVGAKLEPSDAPIYASPPIAATQPRTAEEIGHIGLIDAIRSAEGLPVEDPPLLFKLTVLLGLVVTGSAILGVALVALTEIGRLAG
jgi:hypothetical protein